MLSIIFAPTIGATTKSFDWDFIMKLYAVYGDKNKEYYNLPAGDITVSGKVWTTKKGITNAPLKVYVDLWKDTFGPDTLVAGTSVQPSSTLEYTKSFSLQVDGQKKDQYYLRFYKEALVDDYWDLEGKGSIKSVY